MGVAISEPVASSMIVSPSRADAGALSLAPGRVWLPALRKVLRIGANVHPPHPVMRSAEAITESTGKTLRREGKWVLLSGGGLRPCKRGLMCSETVKPWRRERKLAGSAGVQWRCAGAPRAVRKAAAMSRVADSAPSG